MSASVVYKYPLHPHTVLSLSEEGRLLHVGVQDGQAQVWVQTCPAEPVTRTIELRMVMTGEMFDSETIGRYVGTAVGIDGWIVAHVFESTP